MEAHIQSYNRFLCDLSHIVVGRTIELEVGSFLHNIELTSVDVLPPSNSVRYCIERGLTYEGTVEAGFKYTVRAARGDSPPKNGRKRRREAVVEDEQSEGEHSEEEGEDDDEDIEALITREVAVVLAGEPPTSERAQEIRWRAKTGTVYTSTGSAVITTLPCMVRSNLCNSEDLPSSYLGAHFIVSGHERVLVSQFLLLTNTWLCFTRDRADIRSSARGTRGARIASLSIELRPTADGQQGAFVSLPYADEGRPLLVEMSSVLAALDGDESAQAMFGGGDLSRGKRIITHSLLPHCQHTSQKQECLLHGESVLRATFRNERDIDDRDDASFKRLDMSGELMSQLTRMVLRQHMRSVRVQLRLACQNKDFSCVDIADLLAGRKRPAQLLTPAFRTGIWGKKKKMDIVQALNRFNVLAWHSHLSRVSLTAAERSSSVEMRSVQPSLLGLICCSETPEGRRCGLTMQLARTCIVTGFSDCEYVESVVQNFIGDQHRQHRQHRRRRGCACVRVFVEGVPIGKAHGEPEDVALELQLLRQGYNKDNPPALREEEDQDASQTTHPLPTTVSIYHSAGAVWLWTCAGRLMRPVWLDGRVVLVCARQQQQRAGEMGETDSMAIFGRVASSIPLGNHDQSPRICFSSSMCKQRIPCGTSPLKPAIIHEFELWSGQAPAVTTRTTEELMCNVQACGVNLVVGVCSFGHNQEDALVINGGSVQRGLLSCQYTRLYSSQLHDISGEVESFGKIPKTAKRKRNAADYSLLQKNGIIRRGAQVRPGTCLVGVLASSVRQKGGGAQEEVSECRSTFSETKGRVCRVFISQKMVRVWVTTTFVPQQGDKIMSRHGQKGVIGRVEAQENMPFSPTTGASVDILMNPHGFPTRMTAGQLLESAIGKMGCLEGRRYDCSSFNPLPTFDGLVAKGFDINGEEDVIDGTTGRPIRITVGIVEYGLLDKFSRMKLHARTDGPRDLYLQPTQGKRSGGGQRFGEMERDCSIAHGATSWLRDSFAVDSIELHICRKCGSPAIQPGPRVHARPHCERPSCQGAGTILRRIPRSLLILHYLLLMGNVRMGMDALPRESPRL